MVGRRSDFLPLYVPKENLSGQLACFTGVTGQLVDMPTSGLDYSRTRQLADATGDFACLVFIFLAIY